ncbi:MAG: LPS-assembly protein LptD [Deltaproteobacteria bacterium]|nr:LPS-assembly protein LptD [Deltaproteobacteria bacterium]
MRHPIASLFILLLLILPRVAGAEGPSTDIFKKDSPIDLTADFVSYEKSTGTYAARGNVVITQEGTTLTADQANLDMTSGMAAAKGNVMVKDEGGNSLTGDNLRMNIREKTVVAMKGRIFYKAENIHLRGTVIRKTGRETYNADDISYTTCDCPEDVAPPWSFTASSAELTVGQYLTGWNAFFRIKDVPVLYSPYVSVPIKRERQSGFLQPKPGYSKLRGFVFRDSFFWAISKNTDATFDIDEETARGIGEGAEFRYIRNRRSTGEASVFHFKEKDIERVREFRKGVGNLSRPQDATNNRWRFKWRHAEGLPGGISLKANIDAISDNEYFIDFGKGAQERSLESVESNVSLNKNWSIYSITAQMRFFNNLLADNDRQTLQMLPAVSFTSSNQPVGDTPLYVSSESSFVNFSRKEGVKGQRLDAHPRISLPLHPGGYFDLTPYFAPRATFYLVKDGPDGRFTDRYLYDTGVNLATTFAKVYFTGMEGLAALRHTIRPGLAYAYIPEAVQTGVPQFDSIDNIPPANRITYSLNTILTGKFLSGDKPAYRNIVYMDLSQGYDLNEATKKLDTPDRKRRPLTNAAGELRLMPSTWATLAGRGAYDPYNHWFASYDAEASLSDWWGDSITLARRFIRAQSSYFEAGARARLTGSTDLTFNKRYSFIEGRSLETSIGIDYRHQCWSYLLTYTRRPEERVVYLTFNLLGLGKVAGLQGRIEPM